MSQFLFQGVLDGLNSCGAAHQQDLVDSAAMQPRVSQCLVHRDEHRVHQGGDQLSEFRAVQFDIDRLRAASLRGQSGFNDSGVGGVGQLSLGPFGRAVEPVDQPWRKRLRAVLLGIQLAGDPVGDETIHVVAAQAGIAVTGQHLHHLTLHAHDGDVKCPSAQIKGEDGGGPVRTIVEIGQAGRRGLIDDPQHLQAGDGSGVACRLALGIGKLGGDGDHRFIDRAAEALLRPLLEPPEDDRRDLLRQILFLTQQHLLFRTHQALDRAAGAVGLEQVLVERFMPHQQPALAIQAHAGGEDRIAVFLDDLDAPVQPDGHFAVGRTQVDTDHWFVHCSFSTSTSAGCRIWSASLYPWR